jgi:hypothetical protein
MRFPVNWLSAWWEQMQRQAVLVHESELYDRADADLTAREIGEEVSAEAAEGSTASPQSH